MATRKPSVNVKRALELLKQAHMVRSDARNTRQRSRQARNISQVLRGIRKGRAP